MRDGYEKRTLSKATWSLGGKSGRHDYVMLCTGGELLDWLQTQEALLAACELALDWLESTGADGSPLPKLREAIAKVRRA